MKKFVISVLVAICAMCSAAALASCNVNDIEEYERETNAPLAAENGYGEGGMICSKEGFEAAEQNWYGDGDTLLLSDSANNARALKLTVGESYYFVYTYKYTSDLSDKDEKIYNFLQFCIRTKENTYYDEDAVTFDDFMCDESDVEITYRGGTDLTIKENPEKNASSYYVDKDVKFYYVIVFTPKYTGTLYVESSTWWNSEYEYRTLAGNITFANIYEDGGESAIPIRISNISVDGIWSVSLSQASTVKISFDIDSLVKNDSSSSVYCGLNFNNGYISASLEEAGTGDYSYGNYTSGKTYSNGSYYRSPGTFYDIGYKIPENGKKHAEITLILTAQGLGKSRLEIFFFGTGVSLSGTTYNVYEISPEYKASDKKGEQVDGDLVYSFSPEGYIVKGISTTDGKGLLEYITIPDEYSGMPVIAIGQNAFRETAVEKVTMGNHVREIGAGAFYGSKLKEITLSDNLQKIGASAFYLCQLDGINLPEGLKIIGASAFAQCSLTEINLPFSLTTIGDNAFSYNNFKSVNIPQNVTSIGDDAFAFTNITEVYIPANVTHIGAGAFRNCKNGWSIRTKITVSPDNQNYTVSDGVLFTKDMTVLVAYLQDDERSSYSIPEGVKEIMPYAFNQERTGNFFPGGALNTVTVPDSVEKIGKYAFRVNLNYGSEYNLHMITAYDSLIFSGSHDWLVNGETITADQLSEGAAELLSGDYAEYEWIRA